MAQKNSNSEAGLRQPAFVELAGGWAMSKSRRREGGWRTVEMPRRSLPPMLLGSRFSARQRGVAKGKLWQAGLVFVTDRTPFSHWPGPVGLGLGGSVSEWWPSLWTLGRAMACRRSNLCRGGRSGLRRRGRLDGLHRLRPLRREKAPSSVGSGGRPGRRGSRHRPFGRSGLRRRGRLDGLHHGYAQLDWINMGPTHSCVAEVWHVLGTASSISVQKSPAVSTVSQDARPYLGPLRFPFHPILNPVCALPHSHSPSGVS